MSFFRPPPRPVNPYQATVQAAADAAAQSAASAKPQPAIELIEHQGQAAVRLVAGDRSEALVALHGATLLSWKPMGGGERLFVSSTAVFDGAAPIRGGVPVIFPQFNQRGPLPRHGFARNRSWTLAEQRAGEEFAVASFKLASNDATRAVWGEDFELELTVCIGGQRLDVELEIVNRSAGAWSCQAALHTYLRVDDVETISLEGLTGLSCEDMLKQQVAGERMHALLVDDAVDRVYRNLKRPLLLREPHRSLGIHQQGFQDVVVWNPWEDGNKGIADLEPTGFKRFLCVEAARIAEPIALEAGQAWSGRQSFVALS